MSRAALALGDRDSMQRAYTNATRWVSPGPPEEKPVSYGCVLDGDLIFIPSEIPRRGVFALWGNGSGSAKLELVFPGGTYGIRKRRVSAEIIPLAEALPMLLGVDPGEQAGRPM